MNSAFDIFVIANIVKEKPAKIWVKISIHKEKVFKILLKYSEFQRIASKNTKFVKFPIWTNVDKIPNFKGPGLIPKIVWKSPESSRVLDLN
jgi:hypothetical protein